MASIPLEYDVGEYVTATGSTNAFGVFVPTTDIPITTKIGSCYSNKINETAVIILPVKSGASDKWIFKVLDVNSMQPVANISSATIHYLRL